MAQTGYTPIQLYYSTTAAAVPTAGNLASGELAINITDGKLYFKNNSGTVTLLAGSGGGGPAAGSNTQIQFNSSGVFGASSNLTWDGSTFSTTGLTASGTVTLSGGTANGVLYLNGSKVVTSGSALTFDGTNALTLFRTTATEANEPTIKFSNLTFAGQNAGVIKSSNGGLALDIQSPSDSTFQLRSRIYMNGGSGDSISFQASSNNGSTYGERMILTSTGLGIGTSSPSSKLQLTGASQAATSLTMLYSAIQAGSIGINSSGSMVFGLDGSTGTTTRLNLDTSGNLGLGVTPSAWWSNYSALQVGLASSLVGQANDTQTHLSTNARFDGTNWVYMATSPASRYAQVDNNHWWFNAPSGTAGNAITFTQAMTLDASGNLGVGTTSPATRLEVNGVSEGEYFRAGGGTISARSLQFSSFTVSGLAGVGHQINVPNASGVLTFATGSTERARITSSGNLLLGTTSDQGRKLQVSGAIALVDAALNSVGDMSINSSGVMSIAPYNGSGSAITFSTNPSGSGVTERARIDSSGRLIVGASSNTSSGDAVLAVGGAAVTIYKRATLADGGTLDITVGTSGICYWSGFLCVLNSDISNGGNRTQTNFSICAENQTPTFTTATLQTVNGALGSRSFTITYVATGIIRLTNTSGFTCVATMSFFGGGANFT